MGCTCSSNKGKKRPIKAKIPDIEENQLVNY